MARPTLYYPPARGNSLYSPMANRVTISGADLDNATLNAGEWVTVYSAQVPADQRFFWGYGGRNRESADASFAYADLFANGTGAGTDGDAITGRMRFAIADSTGDDIARKEWLSLGELADAAADFRTERPVQAELQPAAREDRFLEIQVNASTASDGVVVANDSDVRLYYGEYSF